MTGDITFNNSKGICSSGDVYIKANSGATNRAKFNCRLETPNGMGFSSLDTTGVRRPLIWLSSENHLMIGMNRADESHSGNTAVYAKNGDVKLYNKSGGVGFMQTEHENFDGYFRPDTTGRVCLGRGRHIGHCIRHLYCLRRGRYRPYAER